MGKKDEANLEKVVADLIANVGDDRETLVTFTKSLIDTYAGTEQAVGIAEYVAKLMDALTRQNQVIAGTIKTLAKNAPVESEDENELAEIHKEIGLPFEDDELDGSN